MVPGVEDTSLSPRHHDHDGRDLEAEPHDPERMRLMIQITVFLNILKTCFLRLKELWSSQWANQPSRTPGNRSPSGWRTEGIVRLVKGMPNVSPTWSEGWTNSAKEPKATPTTSGWMKRCSGRWTDLIAPGPISQTSKNGNRGSQITRLFGLPPAQHRLATDRFATEARKTKLHRLGCLERSAQLP